MSTTASSISKNLKTKVHSQRLALESRLVFDGAIAVTAADVPVNTVDKPVADTASHTAPPSEPIVAFAPLEKTPVVVDYQPNADTSNYQAVLPVEPKNPIDATNLALSPVTDIGSISTATTLIVVDPRANNAADLLANPPAHAQVFTLDTTRDGFQQVVDLLKGRHDVTKLEVLSWTERAFKTEGGSETDFIIDF